VSDAPRIAALVCPACGGQLGPQVGGTLTCTFCGGRSLVLDGVQLRLGSWSLPRRHQAEGRFRTLFDGLSPPTLHERVYERVYLARTGRVAASGGAVRHGVFGVPLDESEGAELLELADPSVLVAAAARDEAVDPTAALRHFEFRVVRALRDQRPVDFDTSWENDARLVHVPVVESWFEGQLPAHRDVRWVGARPDRRYRIAVSGWNGEVLVDELPRRQMSDRKLRQIWAPFVALFGVFGSTAVMVGGILMALFVAFLLLCLVAWVLSMLVAFLAVLAPFLL
jgi:hypothetical protein